MICSVDLGINTDAVCSIMRADGTILGRKFINFTSDKDHLYHVLGRIRRFQRRTFLRQVQSRWNYAKKAEYGTVRKIAAAITKCAIEYQADVIVFEYLEMQGKLSGKNKNFIYGESGIFRSCVSIRLTGTGSVYPESVPQTPAGWPVTEAGSGKKSGEP